MTSDADSTTNNTSSEFSGNYEVPSLETEYTPGDMASSVLFFATLVPATIYTGYMLYQASDIKEFMTAYFATGFPLFLAAIAYISNMIYSGKDLPPGVKISPLKARHLNWAVGTVMLTTPICWFLSEPVGSALGSIMMK